MAAEFAAEAVLGQLKAVNWRDSIHGGNWHEYAKIVDVWDPERSLEWQRGPLDAEPCLEL
jgi:hypothetical protein